MMQISTAAGYAKLAVAPGDMPDHGGGWALFRNGTIPPRPVVRTVERRADAPVNASEPVPVAIDSETGEPCCVSARQAGLLPRKKSRAD